MLNMFKKFFVFLMICFCFEPSFGRFNSCIIEIINISTDKGDVLVDGNKVIRNKPIYDKIADKNYQKSIAVGKYSLQITANIDVTANGFYPEIKCRNKDISWMLISDCCGLFSLYIADNIYAIKDILGHIKSVVESEGMCYTDIVMQSSSDSQEESN